MFARPLTPASPPSAYTRSMNAPRVPSVYPSRAARPHAPGSHTARPHATALPDHRAFGLPHRQRRLDGDSHTRATVAIAPWERALCVPEPHREQDPSNFLAVLDDEEVPGAFIRSAASAGLGGSLVAAVVLCVAGGTAATAIADQHNPTITPVFQTGSGSAAAGSSAAPRPAVDGTVDEQYDRARTVAASPRDEFTAAMRELIQPDRLRRPEPPAPPPRPRSAAPTFGTVTSSYGSRWNTTHYGLDIANTIGTPVVSASDGEVIESGPADGFGLWVRVLQDDGTIGVYGHINEALVSVGQRVLAGEQIATVGNRGYSTGPHLHYEVWQQDGPKLDPGQWLRTRGVYVVG